MAEAMDSNPDEYRKFAMDVIGIGEGGNKLVKPVMLVVWSDYTFFYIDPIDEQCMAKVAALKSNENGQFIAWKKFETHAMLDAFI